MASSFRRKQERLLYPGRATRHVMGIDPVSISIYRRGWSRTMNVGEFQAEWTRVKRLKTTCRPGSLGEADDAKESDDLSDSFRVDDLSIALPEEIIKDYVETKSIEIFEISAREKLEGKERDEEKSIEDEELKMRQDAIDRAHARKREENKRNGGVKRRGRPRGLPAKYKKVSREATLVDEMEDPAPSLRKMADVLQHITKHYQAGPKSRKERGWLRINKNTMTKEVMSTILSKKPKCGPVPPGEVVVRVAVFHPTKSDKTQEILILGSQKLIDLKNAIDCITENILVEQEGDEIPCIHSSYFYINRTFYDYIAPGDSEPLSQRITTWAKQKEKEGEIRFRRLRNRKMENVRVVDLDIQLGAHYHFCHAIDENHTIIFTEIRFHDAFDPQDRGAYPLDVFKWQEKMRKCCSCAVNHAQLVIYGDKLSASNPAYYCEMCHKAFHKDSQGNDIYLDYHVHPYTHD